MTAVTNCNGLSVSLMMQNTADFCSGFPSSSRRMSSRSSFCCTSSVTRFFNADWQLMSTLLNVSSAPASMA